MSYLFDMHILHTPTVTWSTVNLQTVPALPKCLITGPSCTGTETHNTAGKAQRRTVAWDTVISKRIRPGLLPVSPNQIIVFGGGKACDAAAPLFGDVPADCFLVTLEAQSRPAANIM
jgi:hypothetical protein